LTVLGFQFPVQPILGIGQGLLLALIFSIAGPTKASDVPDRSSMVLVELFTSEGCSSCPPADALLQELDRSQPEAVVLSEHVDYWNQLGWKDPYSSHFYSERQAAYARHFGLDSVYTPEMVVDGSQEFVGSDSRQAGQALEKARGAAKISIRIASVSLEKPGELRVRVEADALPSSRQAEVYLVVALDHAESQVGRGENAGRRLTHAAVARSVTKAGVVGKGKGLAQEVHLALPPGDGPSNLRIVAFVQEAGPGRVLAVTMRRPGN